MLDAKGIEYKSANPIREEDLDKRLSHLEKDFKGLVRKLYRLGIIKKGEEKDEMIIEWLENPVEYRRK